MRIFRGSPPSVRAWELRKGIAGAQESRKFVKRLPGGAPRATPMALAQSTSLLPFRSPLPHTATSYELPLDAL